MKERKAIARLRFAVFLATGMFALMGCAAYATQNSQAPTPGQSFAIDKAELPAVTDLASRGDAKAINRLADYYLLYVGDEAKGVIWLERLGDTGDVEARKSVLTYYRRHPSPDAAKHLDQLRSRWGM
jgi:hypothetical protein